MDEKQTFGQYITSEYSILKGILCNLNAKELFIASEVCMDWRKMAVRLMKENAMPSSFIGNEAHSILNHKYIPKVILHLKVANNEHEDESAVDTILGKQFPLEKTNYFAIKAFGHIGTTISNGHVCIRNLLNGSPDSFVILPEMEGVEIRPYILNAGSTNPLSDESYEEIERSKAFILIVSMKKNRSRKDIQNLLKRIKTNSETCVVAGGLANESDMIKCQRKNDLTYDTNSIPLRMFGMSFGGENVSAVVDLVLDNEDVDEFMKNLAEKVGPLPPNAVRIAFIFICVNRLKTFEEKEETDIFAEHFPNVPIYGFWSLGEYCVRTPGKQRKDTTEGSKRRKISSVFWYKDTEYSFAECSAILVLTFQRPK